jgi:hypothetical protein
MQSYATAILFSALPRSTRPGQAADPSNFRRSASSLIYLERLAFHCPARASSSSSSSSFFAMCIPQSLQHSPLRFQHQPLLTQLVLVMSNICQLTLLLSCLFVGAPLVGSSGFDKGCTIRRRHADDEIRLMFSWPSCFRIEPRFVKFQSSVPASGC